MDHKIYFPTAADYGVYGTRRYPKGSSPAIAAASQGIPTNPHDPNSNPVVVQLHYVASEIAPHATTQRWKYTCPPRRRGRIETVLASLKRDVVATLDNGVACSIKLTRAQHVSQALFTNLVFAINRNNTVGNTVQMVNSGPIELFEGDVLTSESVDDSVGGSNTFVLSATLIEYDSLHPVIGSEARFSEGFDGPSDIGTFVFRRPGGGGSTLTRGPKPLGGSSGRLF